MNLKALDKIQKSYVKLDWREVINKVKLSVTTMDDIIDAIDNFKKNRSAKEIVIFKYKDFPFYVTIKKNEYIELLEFIKLKFIKLELYERCKKIEDIKSKL